MQDAGPQDLRVRQYSEYLTFRSFYTGYPVPPREPPPIPASDDDIIDIIRGAIPQDGSAAVLMSGGMDSAILAPFLPRGSAAYTMYYDEVPLNELAIARSYCDRFGLRHIPLRVTGADYLGVVDDLMRRKGMPLSPAEPVFHLGARAAMLDGHTALVTGSAADAMHGGFAKLRPHVTAPTFAYRLQKTCLDPALVLKQASGIAHVLADFSYETPGKTRIDADRFLWRVGLERFAHDNAIGAAGLQHVVPHALFSTGFDAARNLTTSKYRLREIYHRIYGADPPKKLGMQKPVFLRRKLPSPTSGLVRDDLDMTAWGFNERVLVYFLDRFHHLTAG